MILFTMQCTQWMKRWKRATSRKADETLESQQYNNFHQKKVFSFPHKVRERKVMKVWVVWCYDWDPTFDLIHSWSKLIDNTKQVGNIEFLDILGM